MTEFEMAAAVYRDSQVAGLDALGNIDAYDRRGLLNLVSVLLDRVDVDALANAIHLIGKAGDPDDDGRQGPEDHYLEVNSDQLAEDIIRRMST